MPDTHPTEFESLLKALARANVDYIIVGGVAGTIHGSVRLTLDLDIVYARTAQNIERLASALTPHNPYLRGAPPGLPFRWDAETIQAGLNFTLTTDVGLRVKRAAGRPKDLEAIAELEALLEESDER